jgi:hypothetical protein
MAAVPALVPIPMATIGAVSDVGRVDYSRIMALRWQACSPWSFQANSMPRIGDLASRLCR